MTGYHGELARHTYPEIGDLLAREARSVALLPTGSTEAHGPHLPLATDSILGEQMARLAAEKLAARGYVALTLPPLHYAVTDWAADFPGSAGIRPQTASALVTEVAAAARRMGFDRVVLCNAHLEPDNIGTLRGLVAAFEAEHGQTLLFPDVTRRRNAERLTDEFRSGSCHAGQYETSLVLAVAPELVRAEAAAALPHLHVPIHEKIREGARSFRDCGMAQAYCGDPAGGTAAEGEATYEVLASLVVEAVEASFEPAATEP